MFNPRLKLAVMLSLTLMLSACTSLMEIPDTDQQQWRIEGKLGITTPNESLSGFLIWEQNQDTYSIHVSGPLGQGSTQIDGNNDEITLTQGKRQLHSHDPSVLLYEQMGWRFPITNLRYWVIGEAAPLTLSERSYDEDERLEELMQDGWKIEYFRYDSYTGLPSRLRISQGDWRFLLVIKRWSVVG